MVIADLSDPLLTSAEAKSTFRVLLQQFTRLQGKQRAANGMLAAFSLPTFISSSVLPAGMNKLAVFL